MENWACYQPMKGVTDMNKSVFLFVSAMLVFASVSMANAATLYVDAAGICASNTPCHTTIQSAMNAASPGDEIFIYDGTYAEALSIAKSITLTGESEAGVVIDASTKNSYGISVTADDVTLQRFTHIGPATSSGRYGIKPSGVSNLVISEVTVKDTYRTGIDLNGVNGAVLEDITVINNGGNGLALTDSNDILIRNIVASGNSWGGIAVYTCGKFYPGGSDNITITGTNTFGANNGNAGLYSEEGCEQNWPASSAYKLTNLNLQPSDFNYKLKGDTDVPTDFTWYYFSKQEALQAQPGHFLGNRRVMPLFPRQVSVGTSAGIGLDVRTEEFKPMLWLCDNRVVYSNNADGRLELRERVNNYAFEGEQIMWDVLVLDKNGIEKVRDVYVTVGSSQGEGNPVEANCEKRDAVPGDKCFEADIEYEPPENCNETVSSGDNLQDAINNANAGDVICVGKGTYNEVTINKPLTLVGLNDPRGPDAARLVPSSPAVTGLVDIGADDVTVRGLHIDGNGVVSTGNHMAGIRVNTDISNRNLSNFVIDFNLIEDIETSAAAAGKTALGVQLFAQGYRITNAVISNNIIRNIRSPKGAYGIQTVDDMENVVIRDNKISDVDGAWEVGAAVDCHTGVPSITDVTISRNAINGIAGPFGFAVLLEDCTFPDQVSVNHNDLSGNAYGVLNKNPSAFVDAENNWWGDASGPVALGAGSVPNPGGSGNIAHGKVDYEPWLEYPFCLHGGIPVSPRFCNARIGEEELEDFNSGTMGWYTCTFTVETPDSMHGEYFITAEAEDNSGLLGTTDENEYWFLNPEIAIVVDGSIGFGTVRPGTNAYSGTVTVQNDAEQGSGVLLNMFISGTDFYDPDSSGAKCPTSNVLSLSNFAYYATNDNYHTLQGHSRENLAGGSEGYYKIPYETGNKGDRLPIIEGAGTLILGGKEYEAGNVLSPGAEIALTFRLALPEPCNGDFTDGQIYFWGEAI